MSGCPLEGIKGANYPLTKRLYKKHSIGTVGIHVCDCVRICILYIYIYANTPQCFRRERTLLESLPCTGVT